MADSILNDSGNGCNISTLNISTLPDTQVFVDIELDRKFRKDGYVVVPLLDSAVIQQITDLHASFIPERESDFYATSYNPDPEYRCAVGAAIDRIIGPLVLPMLCGYKSVHNVFLSKQPNTKQGKVGTHQDYTFIDQSRCTGVHLWIPMVDVDENNGCLTMYPGTHSLVNHISAILPPRGPSNYVTPYRPVQALLEERCGIRLPLAAGTGLFFNERTLHSSQDNTTSGKRLAVNAAYIPADERMRVYCPSGEHPDYLDILIPNRHSDLYVVPGQPLPYPYPECYTHIGSIEYHAEPLTPEQLRPLFRSQQPDVDSSQRTSNVVGETHQNESAASKSQELTGHPHTEMSDPSANRDNAGKRRSGVMGWFKR